jgi:hypothetical protein
MSQVATVPLMISEEAAAHIAQLGMQAEFEQMLEHTRQTVSELRRIEVSLELPYDLGDEDGILIQAIRDRAAYVAKDPTSSDWGEWFIFAFAPDVRRHFTFWVVYESNHAG